MDVKELKKLKKVAALTLAGILAVGNIPGGGS